MRLTPFQRLVLPVVAPQQACRCLSSTSWQRSAKIVKDTERYTSKENQYLEHIRETHDPALHIKTLEDELKGAMGKALGKQGEKILFNLRMMEQERERYHTLLAQQDDHKNHAEICECVALHNDWRQQAMTARWELTVHRQAVGFIVQNHKYVTQQFPIGDALPDYQPGQEQAAEHEEKQPAKETPDILKDQLDWWQRVGRWK